MDISPPARIAKLKSLLAMDKEAELDHFDTHSVPDIKLANEVIHKRAPNAEKEANIDLGG
jgi:hypothetical protein